VGRETLVVSEAIRASTVRVVSPKTPGAQPYCTGDGSVGAYDGSLRLLRMNSDGRSEGDSVTVMGSADEIVELLKMGQGREVWLLRRSISNEGTTP
jgi:hypothetical protein